MPLSFCLYVIVCVLCGWVGWFKGSFFSSHIILLAKYVFSCAWTGPHLSLNSLNMSIDTSVGQVHRLILTYKYANVSALLTVQVD